jgi:hypothetical protein
MSATKGLRFCQAATLGLAVQFVGCSSFENAHYVVRNPTSGVVAIPEDTPELRAKAEKLMHEQFPGGYVIDDVHVVDVGRLHHPHPEVMLYYHAGAASWAGGPVVVHPAGSGFIVDSHVQPAAASAAQPAATSAAQPGGLPPMPIPVDAK